jgi:hypothetical protein
MSKNKGKERKERKHADHIQKCPIKDQLSWADPIAKMRAGQNDGQSAQIE